MAVEKYLKLFEEVINEQSKVIGRDKALSQAKKAGLSVSPSGHIVSCFGNPQLVLLRLIKYYTEGHNLEALIKCTPLIIELERLQEEFEKV
ncbi:MAG: hypothetical protein ACOYVF_13975 [Candidatus Zixiibacteriota bacterium]